MNSILLPVISGEITAAKLHGILKKKLTGLFKKAQILLVDRKYQLVTKEELQKFLKLDITDKGEYIKEFHDCDDFSWTLLGSINSGPWAGIAFGFAFSKVHAFNIFIGADLEIYVIEPQSDHIWPIDEIPKKYRKYFLPIMITMM